MARTTAEFGIRLPVAGPLASVQAVRDVAGRAEALGFDALWVHDFIAWTKAQDRTHVSCGSVEAVEDAGDQQEAVFFESLTNLAFLAGITKRVRLGVAVLCLPYRNPIVTAKQIANIDVLSNGRLILGIGVGAAAVTHNSDFELLGIPRNDKYARTRDYFRAMREIWTKPEPEYTGKFVSFPKTEIGPKPVQKPYPPIWVGGGGPKSQDIAAQYGDGWLPPWITPEEYPERIASLKEQTRAQGRDVDHTIATEVVACVARQGDDAWAKARRTVGVLPEGFADDATPHAIAQSGLIGSTTDVRDMLKRYVAAGVEHFELKFVYRTIDDLVGQLDLFASEVMPAFK